MGYCKREVKRTSSIWGIALMLQDHHYELNKRLDKMFSISNKCIFF